MKHFDIMICLRSLLECLLFLGASMVIVTAILFCSDVSESILPIVGRAGQMLAVFVGSLLAAKRAGSKGLFYGAAIAVVMLLILGIIGGLCFGAVPTLVNVVGIMLAGLIGGMVGIGLSAF